MEDGPVALHLPLALHQHAGACVWSFYIVVSRQPNGPIIGLRGWCWVRSTYVFQTSGHHNIKFVGALKLLALRTETQIWYFGFSRFWPVVGRSRPQDPSNPSGSGLKHGVECTPNQSPKPTIYKQTSSPAFWQSHNANLGGRSDSLPASAVHKGSGAA